MFRARVRAAGGALQGPPCNAACDEPV